MASAAEMAQYLNRKGFVSLATSGGSEALLRVPVRVLDARERFGSIDLLIVPIGEDGSASDDALGTAWVSSARVELAEEEGP